MESKARSESFNPRARDGRDQTRCSLETAPIGFNPRARDGRDCHDDCITYVSVVSIHAPVMGATSPLLRWPSMFFGFNPRARDGRDHVAFDGPATTTGFNPRARDGRDGTP